jgi:hypothetical protein
VDLLLPNTRFRADGKRLARRPATLSGATIGFLDGWGFREPSGQVSMYPLMRELRTLLDQRYSIAGFLWEKKANVAQRAPAAQIRKLVEGCAVVINGEAA